MNIRNGTDLAAWALCLAVLGLAAVALWLGWRAFVWIVETLAALL